MSVRTVYEQNGVWIVDYGPNRVYSNMLHPFTYTYTGGSVTLVLTQTCDGCGKYRTIPGRADQLNGGWREVSTAKHLCSECITRALGRVPSGAAA